MTFDASGRDTWKQAAACKGTAANVFFPDTDASAKAAKAICARCMVRSNCLEVALRNKERHGVWGGMTERERARIRRNLRAA
ncbi:MAG: WhiB family transcriptional regulator [Acidimicrobiales bacterium]